jgi:hypothetical protein
MAAIDDPIEILGLYVVGVDEHELTNTVTRKLIDYHAARSRTADDADPELSQRRIGADAKALCYAPTVLGNRACLRSSVPEVEIIADAGDPV